MTYLERFKVRMAALGAAYTQGEAMPKRPLTEMPARDVPVVNALIDVMIGCKMKGQDFDQLREKAEAWVEYEWPMVEPVVAAARNPMGQTPEREQVAA